MLWLITKIAYIVGKSMNKNEIYPCYMQNIEVFRLFVTKSA